MKSLFTLAFALFALFSSIEAQPLIINGVILNEYKEPLESVNIYIMNMDHAIIAGGTTNSEGIYKLEIPIKGDYILSARYLGYSELQIQLKGIDKSINIGSLSLKANNRELGEITITGKPQIFKSDRMLLFPTQVQKEHSTDGFSLLNNLMIPQIDVDLLKKSISSKGKAVTLLLNNRPIADLNEIIAIRPQDIERIEYFEMPTGMLAEYECAINYITRQSESGGYISVNGMQQMTYKEGDYLIWSRLNRKKSEHTIGYNMLFLHDTGIFKNTEEAFTYPDNSILYRTENGQPSNEKNYTHHFFYNYNYKNPQKQFNIKIGYKKQTLNENFNSILDYKGTINQSFELSNFNKEGQNNPYLSFYTDLKLKQQQELYIRGDIDYSKNKYDYTYIEQLKNFDNENIRSKTYENYFSTILGAIYTKKFSREREITLNLHNYTTISNSTYHKRDDVVDERLTMSESLYLLNMSKKWEKIFLATRIGLSTLFYSQKNKSDKLYLSFRPGLTFRYSLNENGTLQYKATFDNSFPTLSLFTNTEQNIDFIQKKKGNPSLKIVRIFSNQLSFSYSWDKINLNAFFNSFHSGPNTGKQVTYNDNYFIHSYINDGRYHFINPELGINIKILKDVANLKINGGLNRYIITGNNSLTTNDWYINASLLFTYKKFTTFLYSYSCRNGIYSNLDQWGKSGKYGLTISYSNRNISLSVGTQNPFSDYNHTSKTNLNIYSYQNLYHNKQNDYLFYAKIVYSIDFGRKYTHTPINIQKVTNSAIMKSSKE